MKTFSIDVSPLQEREYTGIPEVTARLCAELLGDPSLEPGFFYNRHSVPREAVEKLLLSRDGTLLRWASERYCFKPILNAWSDDQSIGLHTNMKFARRLFPVEGQIVHDLTTVVTPDYHTAETNAYHQEKFYGDLMSNDVTFCVSESTAADVRTFFRDLPGPIVVAHLGASWDHLDGFLHEVEADLEDYILVLGTLEPRKNVADMLDLLKEYPDLSRRYRFVFGGRVGWGDAFESQVAARELTPLLEARRIIKTGFVSEETKYLLFRHAAAVVYPSLYEGFGLPVAEAISLNTPVVTTSSSSLPEVGGELASYFVPCDLKSLREALLEALSTDRQSPDRLERLDAWRDRHSWKRCYRTITNSLLRARRSSG